MGKEGETGSRTDLLTNMVSSLGPPTVTTHAKISPRRTDFYFVSDSSSRDGNLYQHERRRIHRSFGQKSGEPLKVWLLPFREKGKSI